MNFDIIATAFAQTAEPAKKTAPIWPMLLALFGVFYFFMIRPNQKKQRESKDMLTTLTKGDKVVTIGGICGTIVNIKEKKEEKTNDDIIVLKVSDNSKIEMIRSSIAKVIPKNTDMTVKS